MLYRNLGSSGLKVSAIGLGTNQLGGKVDFVRAAEIIHTAMDQGLNLIDTADVYQKGRSEEAIGRALKDRRERAVIATKVRHATGEGPNQVGASRTHIMDGVEASLRRLGTDYIDLYQIHRWDPGTPIDETLRALDDLVRQGKVRYIGASNFSGWQLAWANALAELKRLTAFVSIQPHYNLLERGIEAELIPACKYFNIGILPYFPLAGGFLTGKYQAGKAAPAGSRGETNEYVQKYMTGPNYARLDRLKAFAAQRGRSLNDLAHAWLLAQSQISSVISGATSVDQVQANISAGEWALSAEEEVEVRKILESEPEAGE